MSGSAFAEIPGVTSLDGPNISRKMINTTNMDSVEFEEFRGAALADPGTLKAALQFNPSNATHALLSTRTYSGSFVDTWQMVFSDSSSYEFSGSVSDLTIKAANPADGILTADVSIKITSELVQNLAT